MLTLFNAGAQNYSLFNPIPKDQMRPFSIDRPDVTESPISVDAGHFQFEGDLYRWKKIFQTDGPRVINVFNGLYKLGLAKDLDIQFGIELYNIYQDSDGEKFESGYGNTTVRLKYNFWGNDRETATALGIIPYITFPTSPVSDEALYGVGFPFSFPFAGKLGGGAQFQFDFVPNGQSYDLRYLQTIVVGGPVVGSIDFFLEGMAVFGPDVSIYSVNGGLLYNLSPNAKIDIATNLGLVEEAPTNIFLGFSFRL
jgi:hypothetical protein